jgi:TonB C terminal
LNFFNSQRKLHAFSIVFAIILHLIGGLVFVQKSNGKEIKSEKIILPVSIITEPSESPQIQKNIKTSKTNEKKIIKNRNRKKKYRKHRYSKKIDSKKSLKNKDLDIAEPEKINNGIDCTLFDEATCSPCLAEPDTCKKCCTKTSNTKIKSSSKISKNLKKGCENPPCTKKDPCTPNAILLMKTSFCPKVRSSIYLQLGKITLSGVSSRTYLSARVSISVSASGVLSLSSMLKSSNNSNFNSAVKKSIKKSSRVLPPASLSTCVLSRGCVFTVTIGAKPVKKSMSTIKLNRSGKIKK